MLYVDDRLDRVLFCLWRQPARKRFSLTGRFSPSDDNIHTVLEGEKLFLLW